MASAPLLPPPGVQTGPITGAPPNPVSPAPAQPPPPSASMAVGAVHAITAAARSIAEQFPSAVPIVQQINDLVQQLQMKIVQALPPTEVAAPPV
jgi:hypothetical protein